MRLQWDEIDAKGRCRTGMAPIPRAMESRSALTLPPEKQASFADAQLYALGWSIRSIAWLRGRGYKRMRADLLRMGVRLRARNTVGLQKASEETRERLAAAKRGPLNPNYGKPIRPPSPKGRIVSAETRRRTSQTRKERGLARGDKNPMAKAENVRRWAQANNLSPNRQELRLAEVLEEVLPGAYRCNVEATTVVDGKIPDFVSFEGRKVIELFGDYWHRNDDPRERIELFRRAGYQCLVVWEKELKDVESLRHRLLAYGGAR